MPGVDAADDLTPLLARAGVVAVGPGLGRTPWAQALLDQVLEAGLPLVVDADALNLLATRSVPRREDWILTPHPGEAARLLDRPIAEIQNDRFAALAELQARCGGIPVLKGAGTLVAAAPGKPPAVCSQGNPGMAGGGMGDVLTGLVAGFVAQGFELAIAAELGVCLHAAAGDAAAARRGERGLLATDLFEVLGPLLNPEISQC